MCCTDYYLLDGASVLPVLALDLQAGDVVLDMCAAPGGKTLSILQTLMPHMMVTNDVQKSRVNRIHKVIDQYIADIGQWEDRLFVTERDARFIDDKDMFNKVIYRKFIIFFGNNNYFFIDIGGCTVYHGQTRFTFGRK